MNDKKSSSIKFRPIIYQTGFYTHKATQVVSDYLRLLSKNVYAIIDTQSFLQHLSNLPPLQNNEEDFSYDV